MLVSHHLGLCANPSRTLQIDTEKFVSRYTSKLSQITVNETLPTETRRDDLVARDSVRWRLEQLRWLCVPLPKSQHGCRSTFRTEGSKKTVVCRASFARSSCERCEPRPCFAATPGESSNLDLKVDLRHKEQRPSKDLKTLILECRGSQVT